MKPMLLVALVTATLVGHAQGSAAARQSSAPVMPFVDSGACPFEGCVYRDWKASKAVTVVTELSQPWMADSAHKPKAVFTVKPGETVTAMSGVVVFTKPGRARIGKPVTAYWNDPHFPKEPAETIQLASGDVVYLLTYHGEGVHTVWFNGRLGILETACFLPAPGDESPGRCASGDNGAILEKGVSSWWVKIRNARGLIGWTDRPGDFGGKDRYGA